MARPSGIKESPKYVLVALSRTADYPFAIVDWKSKEVKRYIEDRDEGLGLVRELNGVKPRAKRKRGRRPVELQHG